VEPLRQAGFPAKILESENHGFAAGCNFGAREATGEALLFVNPDIQFLESLDGLAELARPENWGTVRQTTPTDGVRSFDLLPEYKILLYEMVNGYKLVNRFQRPFLAHCFAVGSFLVVGRVAFERCGGFNAGFFLYYEEAELCRRLQRLSGRPFYANEVSVLHEGFGSHDDTEQILRFAARGFVDYCRITISRSWWAAGSRGCG